MSGGYSAQVFSYQQCFLSWQGICSLHAYSTIANGRKSGGEIQKICFIAEVRAFTKTGLCCNSK